MSGRRVIEDCLVEVMFGRPPFGRRSRPESWGYRIDAGDILTSWGFDSEDEAFAAAERMISRRCMKCSRIATMNASLGPSCEDHYDDLAD